MEMTVCCCRWYNLSIGKLSSDDTQQLPGQKGEVEQNFFANWTIKRMLSLAELFKVVEMII